MSRIVNISEDNYRLKVKAAGTITLDTGDEFGFPAGNIIVIGNLDVKGTTTTVESSNTTIKDNILQLNYGQTGDGISSALNYQAGLQIGRGNLSDAMFVFDDSVTHYDPYTPDNALSGTFVLKTYDDNLNGLQLTTIATDGVRDLHFDLHNSTDNTLKLVNVDPTLYATSVFGSDPIPATFPPTTNEDNILVNKRYVQSYITSGLVTPGMADVTRIHLGTTKAEAFTSSIGFYVNSAQRALITSLGLAVDNISLYQNTINNTSGTNNLILTSANSIVEVNAVLELDDRLSSPSPAPNTTKLYSMQQLTPQLSEYPGKTGIFFTNSVNSDELISKNRALLFSILF